MDVMIGDFGVEYWPIVLFGLVWIVYSRWQKRRNPVREICDVVFGAYLQFTLDLVFFPLDL